MTSLFPAAITDLPEANIPLGGLTAYLSQAENHQILFMQFEKEVDLSEHAYEAQYRIVLEGKIELVINGQQHRFEKGDRYYILAGVPNSAKIFARYADITFSMGRTDIR